MKYEKPYYKNNELVIPFTLTKEDFLNPDIKFTEKGDLLLSKQITFFQVVIISGAELIFFLN